MTQPVMAKSSPKSTYIIGVLIGVLLFALAQGWFRSLLQALGYVDDRPESLLISILFLACMFVMCVGYGIGLAMWGSRKFRRKTK